jgi:hypothetical protein
MALKKQGGEGGAGVMKVYGANQVYHRYRERMLIAMGLNFVRVS